ncbi:hypothetical protein AVEN_189454-1 [Araneus ventricosus]|uniref:Uncharacterized protein n=1 Tax=Araneus ventricosus TaxID=182803 RepID=A0A4Y2W9B5_ARAVE|nr:hypothetical protein AVEN_36828-1 [Araneus ventricosus]GBO33118.1 hypothetical protein AVEN_189454-1 [Araneus ventricosus]
MVCPAHLRPESKITCRALDLNRVTSGNRYFISCRWQSLSFEAAKLQARDLIPRKIRCAHGPCASKIYIDTVADIEAMHVFSPLAGVVGMFREKVPTQMSLLSSDNCSKL